MTSEASESAAPSPDPRPPTTEPPSEESVNQWAMFTHLSALCCFVGIPSIVGPLVCWLIKKDEMARIDKEGKEAMNFQLTMLIVEVASIPLAFVLVGFFTLFAATLLSIIFAIVAGVAAHKGEAYRYPLTWRMIR